MTRLTILIVLCVFALAGCQQYELSVKAATAVAKVENSEGELRATAAIPFPQTITFDGSQSYVGSADAPASKYLWTWYAVPEGCGLDLDSSDGFDTPNKMQTDFDPPMLGAYMAHLTAEGDSGDPSTNLAVATAFAINIQGLEFSLTWDQDATDLDLHVINTGLAQDYWTDNDCYFGNPTPDWGMIGEGIDNPMMISDVDSGYGPESIAIVEPSDGVYGVAVTYYNDWDTGATTTATVSVRMDGAELHSFTSPALNEGDVVFLGTFQWPSEAATDDGTMYTHGGLNGPNYNDPT